MHTLYKAKYIQIHVYAGKLTGKGEKEEVQSDVNHRNNMFLLDFNENNSTDTYI